MKTSIVMSTYNGQQYIIEQLESIRSQSRIADEVLIFDDCSTDKTVELVRQFITRYNLSSSWKIMVNKQNKGWRRNFIEGLWLSHGDIVFTCDQDDIWRQDKIALMVGLMEKNPQIELLTSNYCEFNETKRNAPAPWKNDKKLHQVELPVNYLHVQSPGCTHCISRRIIELSRKYWQPEYAHDALVWRLAIFDGGLYTYTDALIDWRKHKKSAFAKESRNLKTISEKKKWIRTAWSFNDMLFKYTQQDVKDRNKENQIRILKRTRNWLEVRSHFYQTRNILTGIKLALYWDCFPRYRQYLG
ncbi:glycosyltransferase, partial [Liquorilactobacillus satsumensis]|uniref:glycosyltransferase n=1 Tax=Liquorilactobacillus satsumensis TaxID=259059 RepID=UPI0039EC08FC